MNPPRTLLPVLLAAGCVLPGCVFRETAVNPGGMAPKLARSTFLEQGPLVALVVSTRAMRHRLDRPFLPLEIAVVNKGLASLTLTPESFTLRDQAGNEFPAVGREELSRLYGSTDRDRAYAEALPFVAQKFSSYRVEPSNFTPGFDAPIVRRKVALPRFSYLHDFIYFPRPPDDLALKPLELIVSAPDFDERLFIRFGLEE